MPFSMKYFKAIKLKVISNFMAIIETTRLITIGYIPNSHHVLFLTIEYQWPPYILNIMIFVFFLNITCWYLKIYALLLSSFVSSLNQFYVYTSSDKASQWKWLDLKVWMWFPFPALHYSSKFISCNQSYKIWHLRIYFQVFAKVTLCSHLGNANSQA